MTDTTNLSLTEMGAELDRLQEEEQEHKHAFRVAFDILKAVWPPKWDADYYIKAYQDIAIAYDDNKNNALCTELLLAIVNYLNDAGKKREALQNAT